ncbi:hypothetical protein [Methylobacter sp.]|uniref:hypothetical protein n=1 Tax=Methylobacter sp. TaxID=2051955 RepID=UPI002FDE50E5
MPDYAELYKRLAQEILKRDGQITADTGAFVKQFLTQLRAQGWRLSGDAEAALNAHLSTVNNTLQEAISSAVVVASGLPLTVASLQSETVLKLAEQAFITRWPDGLTLSDRIWRWKTDTRRGVQQQLQAGIRQGKATSAVVYDMQRAIERGGNRFKIVTNHADDWVKELHESAIGLIHDPNARADWNKVVGEAEERIAMLKSTGSRSAAEQVLKQIKAAVDKGSEALVDKAVKWWVYDKQLYNLKRIARTEMADAAHNAVIASVEGDESVIGFQWRLSSSHPTTDICDYYANIEMGLGKGVFTRDTVPQHKAHPHCMCLLVPRVTPIKQKGSKNYAEFVKNATPGQRQTLLPNWAQSALQAGVPLNDLIRSDGLGLVTHKALKAQSPFEAARHKGGAHHGWYLKSQELTDAELEKGIKSLQKQIDKHRLWISDPTTKIPGFTSFHPDRQRNLIERKWPQDIQRQQEQITILTGILRERKHDPAN